MYEFKCLKHGKQKTAYVKYTERAWALVNKEGNIQRDGYNVICYEPDYFSAVCPRCSKSMKVMEK